MENRTILLYFGAAAAVMIALATIPQLLDANLPVQPTVATTATIVKIRAKKFSSRSLRAYVNITFRSPKGLVGYDLRSADGINCQVGDVVKAYQQGADLFLGGDACTSHPTNPPHS